MLNHTIIKNENNKEWIILLHGLGGNSTLFYKQKDFLAKYYNLLLVDLPGHGDCKGLEEKKYTPELIVNKIKELLDHLKIKKAFFLTFSLGTIIGNEILHKASEYVKGMILAGPVLKFNLWSAFLIRSAWAFKSLAPYMTFYKIFASIIMPRKNHSKSRFFFIREAQKLGRKEFVKWTQVLMNAKKSYENMKKRKNNIPKLYLIGKEDYMFIKETKKITSIEKNSELKILDDCGHVCLIEKSNESNEAIIDFIRNQEKNR